MKHYRKNITEEQIRQALKNFAERGGLIRTLPPQVAPDRSLVGSQYAVYESLIEAVGLNVY